MFLQRQLLKKPQGFCHLVVFSPRSLTSEFRYIQLYTCTSAAHVQLPPELDPWVAFDVITVEYVRLSFVQKRRDVTVAKLFSCGLHSGKGARTYCKWLM